MIVLNLKKDLSIWKCKCVQNPLAPAWIFCFIPSLCGVHLQMIFQTHELKTDLKILLQTDYIHSAASWDAALYVTQQQLVGLSPAFIKCSLSHLCPQLSDHLPS